MKRGAYYNEIDPVAAQWLRNLIARGVIADGDVDERSIEDVRPDELVGYRQCHFFAGIGVWSYALRQAGWPDEREVWTGSCPCQPFSTAGEGAGFDDERHLWPAWQWLIAQRMPSEVLGEQVASPDADAWIDLVCDDLEALGYAVGATAFPSAGIGAPHIRDRLYWGGALVDTFGARLERHGGHGEHRHEPGRVGAIATRSTSATGATRGMANASSRGRGKLGGALEQGLVRHAHGGGDTPCGLANTDSDEERGRRGAGSEGTSRNESGLEPSRCGEVSRLADTQAGGSQAGQRGCESASSAGSGRADVIGRSTHKRPGPVNGYWRAADWIFCRPEPGYPDGRWRPIEPGTFPLAHGATARVGRLRAYGNGINAEAARIFIECWDDSVKELVAQILTHEGATA